MTEGQNDIYYIKPRGTPLDLYESKKKHNKIKLYICRVLIMNDSDELISKWLSMTKGVDDLENLPLNTSCETLQQNVILHM
eukprot:7952458-Heterocapsa_arctica.AAC.1